MYPGAGYFLILRYPQIIHSYEVQGYITATDGCNGIFKLFNAEQSDVFTHRYGIAPVIMIAQDAKDAIRCLKRLQRRERIFRLFQHMCDKISSNDNQIRFLPVCECDDSL